MSSSSLPIGWENRSNAMSEKDMKLGGIAATKFRNQNVIPSMKGAYSDETTAGIYQTSDAVRENYYKQIDVIRNHHTQTNDDDNNSINDDTTASSTKSVVETTFSNSRVNPFTLVTKTKETTTTPTTTTPAFWEERQKTRQLEAEGVYRNKDDKDTETTNTIKNQYVTSLATGTPATIVRASTTTSTSTTTSSGNAQLALLRLATHTLETVADTFEQDIGNNDTATVISMEDRTAFATAMQRAMVALADKK